MRKWMDTGGSLTKRRMDKLETIFNRLPENKRVVTISSYSPALSVYIYKVPFCNNHQQANNSQTPD